MLSLTELSVNCFHCLQKFHYAGIESRRQGSSPSGLVVFLLQCASMCHCKVFLFSNAWFGTLDSKKLAQQEKTHHEEHDAAASHITENFFKEFFKCGKFNSQFPRSVYKLLLLFFFF